MERHEAPGTPRWWMGLGAAVAVVLLIALVAGFAARNRDDDVATPATTTSSSSSSTTSSTIDFTTQTTAVEITTTTEGTTTTTLAGVTATTATTVATNNRNLTIEASWAPHPTRVGDTVVFDVRAADADAGPITECGGSPPGGFGDSSYAPGCQVDCSAASTGSGSSASFQYSHVYNAPGTYTVKFSYQSAGGCTANNPGASQRTLAFDITVTE